MLSCDGVFAADRSAEVRRIVGRQRDPHPSGAQRTERMVGVAGVHAGGDVGRRADLESNASLTEMLEQDRVLRRGDSVADPLRAKVQRRYSWSSNLACIGESLECS